MKATSRILALSCLLCASFHPLRHHQLPDIAPIFDVPSRNMVNLVERNLPVLWSAVPDKEPQNIKWSVKLGTRTSGMPVIADGRIFVATNDARPRDPAIAGEKAILMALRESDGEVLWQIVHDESTYCNPIPMCTPTVDSGRIYHATPSGELICASCEDGRVIWRQYPFEKSKDLLWDRCNRASPLVVGDLVFFTLGTDPDMPDVPSFVALDKLTGKVAWRFNVPVDRIIGSHTSSPAYAVVNNRPQVIFGGGDGVLYSFDPPTGKLIWRCDCLPARSARDPARRNTDLYFVGSPVVVGTRLYVGMGVNKGILCWRGVAPRRSWFLCLDISKQGDVSLKSYDTTAPVNRDSALVWAFGGDFGPTVSTAAVHDGLVNIPDYNGYLHCLDADTGNRHWVHNLKSDVWGSPLWADGKIYVATEDGDVNIFAHGTVKSLIATNEMDEYIESTPVAANGVIYVLTRDKLHAISPR